MKLFIKIILLLLMSLLIIFLDDEPFTSYAHRTLGAAGCVLGKSVAKGRRLGRI